VVALLILKRVVEAWFLKYCGALKVRLTYRSHALKHDCGIELRFSCDKGANNRRSTNLDRLGQVDIAFTAGTDGSPARIVGADSVGLEADRVWVHHGDRASAAASTIEVMHIDLPSFAAQHVAGFFDHGIIG
jgi:hypothetical protein